MDNCDSSNIAPENYESDEEEDDTYEQAIPIITASQLREKEDEAEFLKSINEERKNRIDRLEEIERVTRKDTIKIEEKLEETEKDLKQASQEIQTKMKKLEALRNSNERRINLSTKRVQPVMYQMRNDSLNTHLNNTLFKLEFTMKQLFNVKDLREINAPSADESLLSELKHERDKLLNLEQKKLEAELDLAGIRNSLKVGQLGSCSRAEQRAKIDKWNSEEALLTEQLDLLRDEFMLLYSKYPPDFFDKFSRDKLKENL